MTSQSLEISRQKLWLAAIKPPMYSVAVVPIGLGSAIAYAETHHVNIPIFALFLTAAILIVAWSNISNDVYDADTGIDKNKAHSLVNLTGRKTLVFWIGNLCLISGVLGILGISWWQQDITVVGLILMCCALGYSYQGPPFRFGYQGWGELICFLCYGPLALSAAYYSQAEAWSSANLAASAINGITTSLILFCSHFHQVTDDLAAGKRSPIVRLGTARAAALLPWVCGCIYAIALLGMVLHLFPLWTLLLGLSLPVAVKLCQFVGAHHAQPQIVSNCKFIAVALQFLVGVLLGLSFVLPSFGGL
jgi:2-carboxy-1,4-naphthoquinone phytyltransferase